MGKGQVRPATDSRQAGNADRLQVLGGIAQERRQNPNLFSYEIPQVDVCQLRENLWILRDLQPLGWHAVYSKAL
jgi:hypothetical protein